MIVFENPGVLDTRAITIMGMSAKDESRQTIGYFGTGLKYAIAILLRTGHTVTITDGKGNVYNFALLRTNFRDNEFDIVTMNGAELGFTSGLGKNWEVWQAFRELYCNATDEGGITYRRAEQEDIFLEEKNTVRIMISGEKIETVWDNRDKYILSEHRKPKFDERGIQIFEKDNLDNNGIIYCQGIAVATCEEKEGAYDYNIQERINLTEDRTVASFTEIHRAIGTMLLLSSDEEMIRDMISITRHGKRSFEGNINFRFCFERPTEIFLDVVGEMRKETKDVGVNPYAVEKHKILRKERSVLPTKSVSLSAIEQKQLDKAIAFGKHLDVDFEQFPIIVCDNLGNDYHYGRADMESNTIYLSKKCFKSGTKMLVMTLIEEHTHLEHRVLDETVEQKLIYLEWIATLGETLSGEPL